MKQTEEAILLRRRDYSENSLLVTCLTRERGLQTFLFQGGKKKKGNLLYPLAHLELTTFQRADSQLGKISTADLKTVNEELVFNPVKASIAFFMTELLLQTLRPDHAERQLFDLLADEAKWIAHSDHLANYPLWFTAELTKYSGFQPVVESDHPSVLDFSGKLRDIPGIYPGIQDESLHWLKDAFQRPKAEFLSLSIPKGERKTCLLSLIGYLKDHFHGMKELKTLAIVHELFN